VEKKKKLLNRSEGRLLPEEGSNLSLTLRERDLFYEGEKEDK